jgi:hypothetical protein
VALHDQEVAVGDTLEIFVTAVDGDGDKLSYSIQDKPERATFDVTALGARFLWSPISSDVPPGELSYTYSITFFVDDGRGGSDGETVLVTVKRGPPGANAPVFVTPADYVLDLAVTDRLDVILTVQDDDDETVTFELLEAPEGAELLPAGNKSAELVWTPTPAQIDERTLYFVRVTASDALETVEQTITVLLRRKPEDCAGTPPVIAHTALRDQNGPGPYRVQAEITDRESTVRSATLFWTTQASPSETDFQSVSLGRDPGAPDLFAGNIPDLGLSVGASATVTYFLCATDNDDAGGDRCDLSACLPDGQQRFRFVATIGGTTCSEDALEPNDGPAAARTLTPGTPLRALRLCGGDDDWFKVTLAQGDVMDATLTFTHANGNLDLQAYGPNGTTLLAESAQSATGVNEEKLQVRAGVAGTYYLRVFAAAGVANSYDLGATVRAGSSCTEDAREPNDTSAQAVALTPGSYPGLMVCAGNDDWYKIQLRAGDNLSVTVSFTHAQGDLDLEVYRPDRATLLGFSEGTTDTESLTFRVVPESGFYYLKVYGYQNAQNAYSLTLSGGQCQDDALEDNDATGTAKLLSGGTTRSLAICSGDEDYYKVSASAGQTLRVAVRFKHAQGDLDLRVLRPDGTPLASSYSLDDDELVEVRVPTAGTYFVHLFGATTSTQNAYDLEISVSGP